MAFSSSVNDVTMIGNCGTEPEMRFMPNGKAITSFRLATNYNYIDSDGAKKEKTNWFTIVTWGKTAEFINQYLKKGRQIYVRGRLDNIQWTDNNTGNKRERTEVKANTVILLGSSDNKDEMPNADIENESPFQQ